MTKNTSSDWQRRLPIYFERRLKVETSIDRNRFTTNNCDLKSNDYQWNISLRRNRSMTKSSHRFSGFTIINICTVWLSDLPTNHCPSEKCNFLEICCVRIWVHQRLAVCVCADTSHVTSAFRSLPVQRRFFVWYKFSISEIRVICCSLSFGLSSCRGRWPFCVLNPTSTVRSQSRIRSIFFLFSTVVSTYVTFFFWSSRFYWTLVKLLFTFRLQTLFLLCLQTIVVVLSILGIIYFNLSWRRVGSTVLPMASLCWCSCQSMQCSQLICALFFEAFVSRKLNCWDSNGDQMNG